MRNFKTLITDLARKPPILFPLVGLFHVLWLLWLLWSDRNEPFPDIVWLGVLWIAAFTICWLAACDLRRWGAIGYFVLTLLDMSLYFASVNGKHTGDYLSNITLINGLLSIFLLFYYKRFR